MKRMAMPIARGGGGGAPDNGLYEDVTPERVNFFTFPGFPGKAFHQLMCFKGW